MSKFTLELPVHAWKIAEIERIYAEVTLPFGKVVEVCQANRFNPLTGTGEQRENWEAHVNTLIREMKKGEYTPAAFSVSIPENLRETLLELKENKDGETVAKITFDSDNPLSLIDGDHRMSGLKSIRAESEAMEEAGEISVEIIDELPITMLIHLNGQPRNDFVNLQKGRNVDASHLMSLRVHQKLFPTKQREFVQMAFNLTKKLNSMKDSPFHKMIRFMESGTTAPLSVNGLCHRGASDISTSLVGLAKVGKMFKKQEKWLADQYVEIYQDLKSRDMEALSAKHILTPPPEGTKGSATMITGVVSMAVYRALALQKQDEEVVIDFDHLAKTIEDTLSGEISSGFPGSTKRVYMSKFSKKFFSDMNVEKHHGIPLTLVHLLSASTFGVPSLPKTKLQRGRPRKDQKPADTSEEAEVESARELAKA